MNVFGYIRVSGAAQVDKDGPVRQREALVAFCEKHGLTLSHVFEEEGVSGTVESMDRPAFGEMLAKIKLYRRSVEDSKNQEEVAKYFQIDGIVAERMDRLARDLMVSEFLLSECRKEKVQVFCTDQDSLIDMASSDLDPTRVLFRQILGALAQWEKTVLVKKLRAARMRVRRVKDRCEGQKPYGFRLGEDQVLHQMELLRANGHSWTDVSRTLNERGIPTRHGKKWTKATVYACFTGTRRNLSKKKGV